jgi:ribose transport system permease protein
MLRKFLTQSLNEYGMLIVLLLLCVYYSIATVRSSGTDGSSGGESCAKQAMAAAVPPQRVAIVLGTSADASAFATSAKRSLDSAGVKSVLVVQGDPPQIHEALTAMASATPDAVLTSLQDAPSVSRMLKAIPSLAPVKLITPQQSRWPIFLTTQNLLNIGDQISVIAIVAVGMTLVILTGGIDLALGRLSALSAVTVSLLIRDYGGGLHASAQSMISRCRRSSSRWR